MTPVGGSRFGGGGETPGGIQMKDDNEDLVQVVAQAAVQYAKARDNFHAVLTKYVQGHFKEGDLRAPGKKPCGEVPLHDPKPFKKVEKKTGKKRTPDQGVRTRGVSDPEVPSTLLSRNKKFYPVGVATMRLLSKLCTSGVKTGDKINVWHTARQLGINVQGPLRALQRRGFLKPVAHGAVEIVDAEQMQKLHYFSLKYAHADYLEQNQKSDDDILRAMGIKIEEIREKPPLGKQAPLGKVTRVVARGFLATFRQKTRFGIADAVDCRPAPNNTRDGVASSIHALVKRGLVKKEGDGFYSIPDIKKLEASLLL